MKEKRLIIGMVLLLTLSLFVSGCGLSKNEATASNDVEKKSENLNNSSNQSGTSKLLVEVTNAKKDTLDIKLNLTGELEAFRQVDLVPEISGVVKRINIEEGDQVDKGELLLVLDQEIEEAKVEQAESNLKMARAQLAQLEAGAREEEIKQVQANLKQAEANLENVKKNFKRMKNLFEQGVISKSKYDSVQSSYQVAKARVEAAQQKLQLTKKGARTEEIEIAKAKVQQASAAFNLAKSRFNKTTIESPTNGIIAQKNIELSEMASVGKPVVKIVQMDKLEFEGSISTSDLPKVEAGQSVKFTVDAYPEKTFSGKIVRISPTVNPSNRGVKVTVKVSNEGLVLKPGMFANGKVLIDKLNDVLVIPKEAVRAEGKDKKVLVVSEGVAQEKDVKVGPSSKEQIIIKEGLKEGDTVIIKGPSNLQSGTEVKTLQRGEN